jgi:hypothetical protein
MVRVDEATFAKYMREYMSAEQRAVVTVIGMMPHAKISFGELVKKFRIRGLGVMHLQTVLDEIYNQCAFPCMEDGKRVHKSVISVGACAEGIEIQMHPYLANCFADVLKLYAESENAISRAKALHMKYDGMKWRNGVQQRVLVGAR